MIFVAILVLIVFFIGLGVVLRFAWRLLMMMLDINYRAHQEVRNLRSRP